MRSRILLSALAIAIGALAALSSCASVKAPAFPDPPKEAAASPGTETAVLAGGCFWGVEGIFERLKGVKDVVSGYSGGTAENAEYELVSTGTTGHAESVRITYDPAEISFGTLLKVFFSVAHDPTQLDYQGPDVGTQYRSAIFCTSEGQRSLAERYIQALDRVKAFPRPIVTQVVPLVEFFPAEEYHQDFMENYPDYPYIVHWDQPKVENLVRLYPGLLVRR